MVVIIVIDIPNIPYQYSMVELLPYIIRLSHFDQRIKKDNNFAYGLLILEMNTIMVLMNLHLQLYIIVFLQFSLALMEQIHCIERLLKQVQYNPKAKARIMRVQLI